MRRLEYLVGKKILVSRELSESVDLFGCEEPDKDVLPHLAVFDVSEATNYGLIRDRAFDSSAPDVLKANLGYLRSVEGLVVPDFDDDETWTCFVDDSEFYVETLRGIDREQEGNGVQQSDIDFLRANGVGVELVRPY